MMQKQKFTFIFIFLFLFNMMNPLGITVFAHSGGTDEEGGHQCWTDCGLYGYENGEYHFHDGRSTNDNYNETNIQTKKKNDGNFDIKVIVVFLGIGLFLYLKSLYKKKKENGQTKGYEYNNVSNLISSPKRHNFSRGIAILSVVINFILLILILITYSNEENISANNKEMEPLDTEEAIKFTQEEYEKLQSDNSILEERILIMVKEYNDQISYTEELEKKVSEIETSPLVNSTSEEITSENKNTIVLSDQVFFTLGSSQDEVKRVMGTPDSIIGDWWGYEYSHITFEDGIVSGWSNTSDNLKVNLEKSNSNITLFTLGSSYQDVINVMGTPDSIVGDWWGYEYSHITFDNGIVSGWSDISDNLKVK